MKIISIQEAYQRKFQRQRVIPELQYHASGHCVHIGKISPGCYGCFVPDPFSRNICSGAKCNLNCVYCTDKEPRDFTKKELLIRKAMILRESYSKNYRPSKISFSGGGDPLLYMDVIADYMKLLRNIEKRIKHKPLVFSLHERYFS
jgi:sulfatase maturation enzyme AslB (radical SAM superfamily)